MFAVGARVHHEMCYHRGEPSLGTVRSIEGHLYMIEWDEHKGMVPEPHEVDELLAVDPTDDELAIEV